MKSMGKIRFTLASLAALMTLTVVDGFAPNPSAKIIQRVFNRPSPTSLSKSNLCSKSFSYLRVANEAESEAFTIDTALKKLDDFVIAPVARVASHLLAFASLSYFGLISMTQMMGSGPLQPTLTSVLSKGVGPTTAKVFSEYFPTLVTPPSFIFNIWPLIAATQFITLTWSALKPGTSLFSQENLSALALANAASTGWLVASSNASPGVLPLSCFYLLPLVPLSSGFPLRRDSASADKISLKNLPFQLYSGFTTLASVLALTVELQNGGRVPLLGGNAELCALVFLGFYRAVLSRKGQGKIRQYVNAAVISGIFYKRICMGFGSLRSPSFFATAYVVWISLTKLRPQVSAT